jgi:16S rRNA (guanine527-N7)-methyltransferase
MDRAVESGLDGLARRYDLADGAAQALGLLTERLIGDERAPTAIREPIAVLQRHIADSLVGLEVAEVRVATRAVDLGSGAGLPGLALAAALPATEFRLVESQQRKCAYIADVASTMKLPNARVVCARAEQWPEGVGDHDLALARALAPQPVVLEYAAPLLALGGRLVEWRGRRDEAGEESARRAAAELGLRSVEVRPVFPFDGAGDRHLHVFEKVAPTPARFPRRPGRAAKRPLGS